MKLELEVDEGSVGKTVEEILKSLTPEKKLEVAREVAKEWLANNIHKNERQLHEKTVIDKIRQENYWRDKPENDIRNSHAFDSGMREFQSSRDIMVKAISQEVTNYYKELVRELVEKDPVFLAMREEVGKVVKESFPKMVHDALLHWFAGQMNVVMGDAQSALRQIPQLTEFQNKLAERLQQISGVRT